MLSLHGNGFCMVVFEINRMSLYSLQFCPTIQRHVKKAPKPKTLCHFSFWRNT
jgi:hypothetical protein